MQDTNNEEVEWKSHIPFPLLDSAMESPGSFSSDDSDARKLQNSLLRQYVKSLNSKDKQLHKFLYCLHVQRCKWDHEGTLLREKLREAEKRLRRKTKEAIRSKSTEASHAKAVEQLSLLVEQLKCRIRANEGNAFLGSEVLHTQEVASDGAPPLRRCHHSTPPSQNKMEAGKKKSSSSTRCPLGIQLCAPSSCTPPTLHGAAVPRKDSEKRAPQPGREGGATHSTNDSIYQGAKDKSLPASHSESCSALPVSTKYLQQDANDSITLGDPSANERLNILKGSVRGKLPRSARKGKEEKRRNKQRHRDSVSIGSSSSSLESNVSSGAKRSQDHWKSDRPDAEHSATVQEQTCNREESCRGRETQKKKSVGIGTVKPSVFSIGKEVLAIQNQTRKSDPQDSKHDYFRASEESPHPKIRMFPKEEEGRHETTSLLDRVLEEKESEARHVISEKIDERRAAKRACRGEVETLKKELQKVQMEWSKKLETCKEQMKSHSSQLQLSISSYREKYSLSAAKVSQQEEELAMLRRQVEMQARKHAATAFQLLEEQWMCGRLRIEKEQLQDHMDKKVEMLKEKVKKLNVVHHRLWEEAQTAYRQREAAMRTEMLALEGTQTEEMQKMCETFRKERQEMDQQRLVTAARESCVWEETQNRYHLEMSEASKRMHAITKVFGTLLHTSRRQHDSKKSALEEQRNILKEEVLDLRRQCSAVQRRSEEVEKDAVEAVQELTSMHEKAQLNLSRSQMPSSASRSIPATVPDDFHRNSVSSYCGRATTFSRPPRILEQPEGAMEAATPPSMNAEEPASSLTSTSSNPTFSTLPLRETPFQEAERHSIRVAEAKWRELQAILSQKVENEKISQELHRTALQSSYDEIHSLKESLSSSVEQYNALKAAHRHLQQRLKEKEECAREAEKKVKELSLVLQDVKEKSKKERAKMDILIQQYADKAARASDEERSSRRREGSLVEELEKCEAALERAKQEASNSLVRSTRSSSSSVVLSTVGSKEEMQRDAQSSEAVPRPFGPPSSNWKPEAGAGFSSGAVSRETHEMLLSEFHSCRQAFTNLDRLYHQSLEEERKRFVEAAYREKTFLSGVFLDVFMGGDALRFSEVERSCRGMCAEVAMCKEGARKKIQRLEKQINSMYQTMLKGGDRTENEWQGSERDGWHTKLSSALQEVQTELQQERSERVQLENVAAVERNELERKLHERDAKLASLRSSNDRLEEEKKHYKVKVERLMQQVEETEAACAKMKRESETYLHDAQQEVNALKMEADAAGVNEKHLLTVLKDLQQELASSKQMGVDRDEQLQCEKMKLKNALQQLDDITNERNNSFAEALQLQEKVNALTIKLSAAKSLSHRETMQRTEFQARIESQLDELESRLSSSTAEKRALEHQLEALRSQMDSVRREMEAVRLSESEKQGIIQKKCSEISILRERVANGESIHHILEARWRESQERESNLSAQLDEVRRSHQLLKVSFESLQEYQKQLPGKEQLT